MDNHVDVNDHLNSAHEIFRLPQHSQAQTGVKSGTDLAVGMYLGFVRYLKRDGENKDDSNDQVSLKFPPGGSEHPVTSEISTLNMFDPGNAEFNMKLHSFHSKHLCQL
ncbi:hypothetical protein STEG23_027319 [Scotinomys teguina]